MHFCVPVALDQARYFWICKCESFASVAQRLIDRTLSGVNVAGKEGAAGAN